MRRFGPRCLCVPFPGCCGRPSRLQSRDQGTGRADGCWVTRAAWPGKSLVLGPLGSRFSSSPAGVAWRPGDRVSAWPFRDTILYLKVGAGRQCHGHSKGTNLPVGPRIWLLAPFRKSFSRGALAKDLPSPPQITFALNRVSHAPNLTDSTSFAFQHMTPGAAWPMDAPESWGSRSAVSGRARWGPAGRRSSGALRVWDSGVPEEGDPGPWVWLSKVPTAPTTGETTLYKS